uniref:Uncharacterized protein n=1 Tax=Micrococcus phage Kurnik TaxID=3092208 RepID=A0AAU6R650_9CAUD
MALAKMDVGNTPSEFGGVPGLYGNVDGETVVRETTKTGTPYSQADPLRPHQARMALTQTDPADSQSSPAYGVGGAKVA